MKKHLFFVLVAFLATSLVGGGSSFAQGKEKTWTLRWSTDQPEKDPVMIDGHLAYAKAIEEATKGRVKVTVYPLQTLAKAADAWDAVKTGVADMVFLFTGLFPNQFDMLDSIALPFIAPNAQIASKTAWKLYEKYPEIQAQSKDVKVLFVLTTDPYFFVTTKKQIKTIEDFKGIKIRMTGGPPTEMMKLLGGTPLTVPMADAYLNLQKGVMDGMGVQANAIKAFRIYEVVKYYTIVPASCVIFMVMMNKKVWESMPPDIQQAIISVSGEKRASIYGSIFDAQMAGLPSFVKQAGYEMVSYTPPKKEIDRWINIAGKPVWDKWIKTMEAKGYKNAPQILNETLEMVKVK